MDNSIKYVNIEDLIPGEFQARFEDDNLDNLASSIKKYGIIVPLVTREKDINQYEIILGNRRYKAAKQAGLTQVPIIVVDANDEKVLDIVISDNVQRKELTAKEEGFLYNKDLEYTNNNEDNLSNKLGIPKDRILSKLNILRKNKQPKQQNTPNNETIINNISDNSSINEDIINLTELNQKEGREDFTMNNNQNINTNSIPDNNQQQVQEPTFGGRFFPSLEDQPTNMNMNQNISAFTTPQEPLIDLTDSNSSAVSQPTLNQEPVSNSNVTNAVNNQPQPKEMENTNNTESINSQQPLVQDIQKEEPIAPNLDVLSGNIIGINSEEAPTSISNNNVPSSEVPQINNISNDISNNDFPQEQLNNNLTPLAVDNIQREEPSASNLDAMSQNIVDNNVTDSPISLSNTNSSETNNSIESVAQPVNNKPIDISNNLNYQQEQVIPSNQPEENINPPELNQNTIAPENNISNEPISISEPANNQEGINIEEQALTKDIIPVINMIKSLAVNIENLGYKLNISEEENTESYSINIEIEK